MIHLGYEVGTGRTIDIPVRNLAVTGQTQESGKTTTLEALVARSGLRAIAFVTKRGERAFAGGRRIQPYFRDRADWQFVDQLLEAQLHEKNKFLRPWIIRICRTTRTLADVQRAVRTALAKAKGIHEGVYTQLDAYLELIVPELERARLADRITLEPGLNVMDVSGYATPMQMLFVQSALDWVGAHEQDVVTIIPEAWEFIPEGKGSPAKAAAVALIRKGSGLANYVWVDSQDMAGVDKTILRGCPVWLIGVQREANEIKRNLANIPASLKRPRAADVATLRRGEFYACFHDRTVKVYVQPAWLSESQARAIALGETVPIPPAPPKEDIVTPAEAKALEHENVTLRARVRELEDQVRSLTTPPQRHPPAAPRAAPAPATMAAIVPDDEGRYQAFKARLIQDAERDPALLRVLVQRPEIEVQVKHQVVTAEGSGNLGWTARLIAEGFFDETRTANAAWNELKRRGYEGVAARIYESCASLCAKGFLTRESEGYRAVAGMKVNIVEG